LADCFYNENTFEKSSTGLRPFAWVRMREDNFMCEHCKEKFYITTPIYYPSDYLHIGHTYCTVATDAMARYKRLRGYDVMFLTGTDEHGMKIEERAAKAGVTPKQFVDRIVEGERGVKDLWKLMNISYDRFIRTTDDYHCSAIQKIFEKMYANGDIYKGSYKGMYCTPCESFWTESQLVDGKCPDCGREVHEAEEEAYFFRLSNYADKVQTLLETTDFLEPRSRVNEMVNNFLKPGLEDLCVSRTSFKWGIPVTFDPGHVVYVWVDALFNYATALGYCNDRYHDFEKYWPADVHFVGKEIVRFHTIVWPAMLMSVGRTAAEKGVRAWLAAAGRRENVKVQGQRGRPLSAGGALWGGQPALFPAAFFPVRLGRKFFQ
jgi:methionyl-tRNA synthetase